MPLDDYDPLLTTILPADILAAGLEPAAMSGDQGSFTARSIDDLVKARNAAAAVTASTKPHRGIRFSKFLPVYED